MSVLERWQHVDCNCLFPRLQVINFEINLIFLTKSFSYMPKNLRQTFKYLENGKSFQGEIKSISYHFWRVFCRQELSQTWEWDFNKLLLCCLLSFIFTREGLLHRRITSHHLLHYFRSCRANLSWLFTASVIIVVICH